MLSVSQLLLTYCVIMTGSSVNAAGHAYYQLVFAPVVKRHISGAGPLENSRAISRSGPVSKDFQVFFGISSSTL